MISPSLLSADHSNFEAAVKLLNNSQADWIHVDVMDGHFVPNITFGMPVIKSFSRHAKKPLDVHLMIEKPDNYLQAFRDAGSDILSVHYEACTHLNRSLQEIRRLGMKSGLAINPHTPVCLLKDILEYVDVLLIMSVNPGFGGQKFIPGSLSRIREAKAMIEEKKLSCLIEVDGGVSITNARELINAGADILVAGNAVFGSDDPLQRIKELKEA